MIQTTPEQRKALKRVYDRVMDSITTDTKAPTYREWRATCVHLPPMDDCLMVEYAGMWLGIETDGYTHS